MLTIHLNANCHYKFVPLNLFKVNNLNNILNNILNFVMYKSILECKGNITCLEKIKHFSVQEMISKDFVFIKPFIYYNAYYKDKTHVFITFIKEIHTHSWKRNHEAYRCVS